MKRIIRMSVCAALVAMPAMAIAQGRPITLGVSGGASLPIGDLGDAYSVGYAVAGHVYLKPASSSKLGFRGDVGYDSFSAKSSSSVSNANYSVLSAMANVMVNMGEEMGTRRPYILGGGGLLRSKSTVKTSGVDFEATSSDLGVQGGVGMNFALSGFSTFLEAKYVYAFVDNGSLSYIPITFGIKF